MGSERPTNQHFQKECNSHRSNVLRKCFQLTETLVLQTFLSAIICASLSEMRLQMGEQVRGLDSQAESRQQLLQDVADFLRRKAEVEQEYSRGLEKLSERFSAKIRGSKEHQNFRLESLDSSGGRGKQMWRRNFHRDKLRVMIAWEEAGKKDIIEQ